MCATPHPISFFSVTVNLQCVETSCDHSSGVYRLLSADSQYRNNHHYLQIAFVKLVECAPRKVDTDTKVSRFKRKLVLQIKRPCQISTSKFLRHVRCLVAKQAMEAAKDMRFLCERQQALVRTLLKDTTYFLLRFPESEPPLLCKTRFFPLRFSVFRLPSSR